MYRLAFLILVTAGVSVLGCDVCGHGYSHPSPVAPQLYPDRTSSYRYSLHESYYTFNNGTHTVTVTSRRSAGQGPEFLLEIVQLTDGAVVERSTLTEAEYAARRAILGLTGTAGAFGLDSLINSGYEYEEHRKREEHRRQGGSAPSTYPSEYYMFYNSTHSTKITKLSASGEAPLFHVVVTRSSDNVVIEDSTLTEDEYRKKRISLGLRGPKGAFGMTSLLHGHDSAEDRAGFFRDLRRRQENPSGWRYSSQESFYTLYNSTHSTTITRKTASDKETEFQIVVTRLSNNRVVEDSTLTEDEYRIRRARLGLTGPDGAFGMDSLLNSHTADSDHEEYYEHRQTPQHPTVTRYLSEESYYTFYNGTHSTTITRKVPSDGRPEFHLVVTRLSDNSVIEDSVLTETEYADRRANLGLSGPDGAFGMPSLLARTVTEEERYFSEVQRHRGVQPQGGAQPSHVTTTYSSEEGWYSVSNGTHTTAIKGRKNRDGVREYLLELIRDSDQAVLSRFEISKDEFERRRKKIAQGIALDDVFDRPRYASGTGRHIPHLSQREYTSTSEQEYSSVTRREEERRHSTAEQVASVQPAAQPARAPSSLPSYPAGVVQNTYTRREDREETLHRTRQPSAEPGGTVPQPRRPAPQLAADACSCVAHGQCHSRDRALTREAEERCRFPMVCCRMPSRPQTAPSPQQPESVPSEPVYRPQRPQPLPQQPEAVPQSPVYQPQQPGPLPRQPESHSRQPEPNLQRPDHYQRPASHGQPEGHSVRPHPQPVAPRPAPTSEVTQETFRNIVQHVETGQQQHVDSTGQQRMVDIAGPRRTPDHHMRRLQSAMTALDQQHRGTVHRDARVMQTDSGSIPQTPQHRGSPRTRTNTAPGRINSAAAAASGRRTDSRDEVVTVSRRAYYPTVAPERDAYDMSDLGMTHESQESPHGTTTGRQYTYQQTGIDSQRVETDDDDYYGDEEEGVESHSTFYNRPLQLPRQLSQRRPQYRPRRPAHISASQFESTQTTSQEPGAVASRPQQPQETVSGLRPYSYAETAESSGEEYPVAGSPAYPHASVSSSHKHGEPTGTEFNPGVAPVSEVPSVLAPAAAPVIPDDSGSSRFESFGTSSRHGTSRHGSETYHSVPSSPVSTSGIGDPPLGSPSALEVAGVQSQSQEGFSSIYHRESSRTTGQEKGAVSAAPGHRLAVAGVGSQSSQAMKKGNGIVSVPYSAPLPAGGQSQRSYSSTSSAQPAVPHVPAGSSYRTSWSSRSSSGVRPGSLVYTYRYTQPVVASYPAGVSRSYSYRSSSSSSSAVPASRHYSSRVGRPAASSSYYRSYSSHG